MPRADDRRSAALSGWLAAVFIVASFSACTSPEAAPTRSYDEVRHLVLGKNAVEVEALLGPPDTRRHLLDENEAWVWWSFATLDGNDHPPELRGRIVHLEISFRNVRTVDGEPRPRDVWRVDETFGIRYLIPSVEP